MGGGERRGEGESREYIVPLCPQEASASSAAKSPFPAPTRIIFYSDAFTARKRSDSEFKSSIFQPFPFFPKKIINKSCPPFVNWPFSRRRGRKDLIKSGRPTRPQTTILLTSPPTRRSSFGIRAFLARNGREMDGWKDSPPLNSKWFSRRENG